MERTRRERNRGDEQEVMRRMKDEFDQALAKQLKIANEQLSLVIKSIDYFEIDFNPLFIGSKTSGRSIACITRTQILGRERTIDSRINCEKRCRRILYLSEN
jgi:hypothetical protein